MAATSDGIALPFTAADIGLLRHICVMPDAGALLDRFGSDPSFGIALRRRFGQIGQATSRLLQTWEAIFAESSGPSGVDDIEGPGRYLHLFAALAVLEGLLHHEVEPDEFDLVLHRPAAGKGRVQVHADEPTLVLTPGSLASDILVRAAATPVVWAITAVLKPLLGKAVDHLSGKRDAVLHELRQRQITPKHPPKLQNLEKLDEGQNLRHVIVFVHGLFSTDLGTFDPLVDALRGHSELARVGMIGFPHNPLEPIDKSAGRLAHLVLELSGRCSAIAFVAHHRGGLVVRAAACQVHAQLGAAAPGARHPRLLGCVTFGTPHLGIPGADNDARTLGAISRLAVRDAFGAKRRGFMTAKDLLRLRAAMADSEDGLGLADLLPVPQQIPYAGPQRWLTRLQQQEAAASRAGASRKLRIHAIGGDAPSEPMWRLLRPPGVDRDDWLVPTASSAPRDTTAVESVLESEADHSHYFDEERVLADAAAHLGRWFDAYQREVAEAAIRQLRSPGSLLMPKMKRPSPPSSESDSAPTDDS